MAAKRPSPPTRRPNRVGPIVGLILGGAGLAVLMGGVGIFITLRVLRDDPPPSPPVVVETPESPPEPTPTPTPTKTAAWWDGLPDSNLAGTVAVLKDHLPRDQTLLDSLGSKSDLVRLDAYQKLAAKLPELRNHQQARIHLERLLTDCYALDPNGQNVAPLREWLVKQIPVENAEIPAGYKGEDLDRSFWAIMLSVEAATHAKINVDRATPLADDLGKAIGFAVNRSMPRAELIRRAEKLVALRCYRNVVPTAAKSIDHALAMRDLFIKKVPDYLSPSFRERIDIELAVQCFPSAKKAWPAYSALLGDCLKSEDQSVELELVNLYAQADPELAAKLEPLLAGKWKVVADKKLNQVAKVKTIQRSLGVPDPAERLTRFEKMARETLARAKPAADESYPLLQETVRLAHASTLASALLRKEQGQARFDQLFARVPELDLVETKTTTAKVGDTKEPAEPVVKLPPGVVAIAGPKVFQGALTPGSPRDAYRVGCFRNVHLVSLRAGRTYDIYLVSNFDNYLRLENSAGRRLAEDDDSGGNLNARIFFPAPYNGTYRIVATSCSPNVTGPYTLTVQEVAGGMPGPGFGNPFFPRKGFPGPPPQFGPTGLIIQQPPPVIIPGKVQPPADQTTGSQVEEADVNRLKENLAKIRIAAFQAITSKLKGDLTQNDITAKHAKVIARYLMTRAPDEVTDAVTKFAPAGRSRNLMLALADFADHSEAQQKSAEAVVGAILEQPVQFGKDEWRPACRKLLLVQALDLWGKNVAGQAADILRDLYKEQGVLLGSDPASLQKLTRPAQVMERMSNDLAIKLAKESLAKEDKAYLDQLPRHLLAAQSVAQNDLERTVLVQRVWCRVLSIYLAQQSPDKADDMRKVQDELGDADRRSANVLEQLRGGEEKILKLWGLALDLK